MNQRLLSLANRIEKDVHESFENLYEMYTKANCMRILKRYNPKYLGFGSSRFVFKIVYYGKTYVVKIDIDYNVKEKWCYTQNKSEIEVYDKANDVQKKRLYSIFAYSEKRSVVIGEYIASKINLVKDSFKSFSCEIHDLFCEHFHVQDLHPLNMGKRDGIPVLVDFGHFIPRN